VVAEANGEGEDGVGGVGEAGAGEDGAGADVGVGEAVEAKVGVDYAGGFGGGHAHAAHVVVAVIAAGEEVWAAGHEVFVGNDLGDAREGALGDEDVLADGVQFPFGYLPVEADAEEAQGVALISEGDGAAGGWLLFAVDAEEDADFGRSVGAALDEVSPRLAEEHGDVFCGVGEVVSGDVAEASTHEVADGVLGLHAGLAGVFEAHGGTDAEGSELGLELGRQAELGKVFEAAREDGIEGVVEAGEVVRDDLGGVAVDVILKVLAEETGAVPGEAAGARLEEEAGAFNAPECEDVLTSVEGGFDAGERAAAEAGGGVALGEEFDGVGVEPEVEVGVGGEGLVVEAGEVRLGTPAGEVGFEVGELGEGLAEVAPDGGVAALDFREAFELEGSLVERGEF